MGQRECRAGKGVAKNAVLLDVSLELITKSEWFVTLHSERLLHTNRNGIAETLGEM